MIDPYACRDCWMPARPQRRTPPADWHPWDEPAPEAEAHTAARRAARTNPTTKETS